MLQGKKIILGISGGIAAYKSPLLIRMFIKAGAEVKVVTTKNALQFVTLPVLETLSRNKVYSDVFAPGNDYTTEHVSLTDWGDIFLVAPATANIIGKYASGIADDALSTSLLAFNRKVFMAPAMNTKMLENFSVRKNIEFLKSQGVSFIDAPEGDLACGYEGKGRMEEPDKIMKFIEESVSANESLKGKKVLISAGPTYEPIDPVRFIGNHSSGLMGFELAKEAANRGAEVTLVAGPSNHSVNHTGIHRIDIVTAEQMYSECLTAYKNADLTIMAAAVADFKPATQNSEKIKKSEKALTLELVRTKDILAELGKTKKAKQILVGFALETRDEIENAKEKLMKKNLDFIVLNSLKEKGAGFGYGTNKVTIINKKSEIFSYPLKPKSEVACDILDLVQKEMK